MGVMKAAMVTDVNLQEIALTLILSQLTDAKLFQVFHPSKPASWKALAHCPTIQVICIQVHKVTTLFFRVKPIAHVLVVCLHISMNGLSDATSSTLLTQQQSVGVNDESQFKPSLLDASLPSQSGRGVKVNWIGDIVFQAGCSECFKDAAQEQHIGFEIVIGIISQIVHPKCFPNPLGIVIVAFTDSGQVELTVRCFYWGEVVLLKLPQSSTYS